MAGFGLTNRAPSCLVLCHSCMLPPRLIAVSCIDDRKSRCQHSCGRVGAARASKHAQGMSIYDEEAEDS